MRKNFINLLLFVIIIIVIWIYWSSNVEFSNTVSVLTRNDIFLKQYLIQPNKTCEKPPFLVIIVTSYVGHVELRSAHRRAMPQEYLNSLNVTRVFLLAKIPHDDKLITQEAIEDENKIYGDILQGFFIENYRNLTYKHLMGLHWASTVCSKAAFILKIDDDIVFNLESTLKLLKEEKGENLLLGYMLNNTKPRRNKQNKWYVSPEEYSRNNYPSYLSGWYYTTTPKIAARISEEAVYHPYFWIDDIFITGILTESLDIKLKQVPPNYWLEYYELLECCLKDMIVKNIKCDYVVGPNGNRNNLIVEFNKSVRHCNSSKNCKKRSMNQLLNETCVTFKERSIFSNGQAQVQYINL